MYKTCSHCRSLIFSARKRSNCVLGIYYSTKKDTKIPPIKYTSTINLPKTTFPTRVSVARRVQVDEEIKQNSAFDELYSWQRNNLPGPDFILHDGPPYANGDLHIGHAINKILKDITIRHKVISGQRVHYVPGWDCHGLPIELRVLNDIREDIPPHKIREKARRYALDTVKQQQESFELWGIMANWSSTSETYRTTDKSYIQHQLLLFLELYEQGYLYQDLKPVYWSPESRTALAESELIYDEQYKSPSLYFRVELQDFPEHIEDFVRNSPIYALIWTTTPWTLASNKAVCYNPEHTYSLIEIENISGAYLIATDLIPAFAQLLNKNTKILTTFKGSLLEDTSYKSLLGEEIFPFLEGEHVTLGKGTGLVHTAPAHGAEDFLVAKKFRIDLSCIVDENGRYSSKAPDFLRGLDVLKEGNKTILNNEDIKKNIIHLDSIVHSYPLDWRTKTPVILRASKQWFIDTDKLKKQAVEALKGITLYPSLNNLSNMKGFVNQIEKRPYWCISRQRSWGVPIPVLYDKTTNKPIINRNIVSHLCEIVQNEGSIDAWFTKSLDELIPEQILKKSGLKSEDVYKGNDILDIWLDSGASWLGVIGRDKIADLYLEGVDQFRGWFQSSLLTSVALRGKAPYKNLFVHGFAVDEKGLKMSKSLGNVISPTDIIKGSKSKPALGVDTLRWWVANHSTQHALIPVSETLLNSSSENIQRLRLVLKFLLGAAKHSELVDVSEIKENKDVSFSREDKSLKLLDKYMFHKLYEFDQKMTILYESYEYNRVCAHIMNFVANSLSGLYLHVIKDRLYCDSISESDGAQLVLVTALGILCRALWPILPHLVEEAWSHYAGNTKREPFYHHPPHVSTRWYCPEVVPPMELAFEMRSMLNSLAKQNTWLLSADITINERIKPLVKMLQSQESSKNSELCDILQLSSITLYQSDEFLTNGFNIEIRPTNSPVCPRCRRHSVDDVDHLCERCNNVLNG